MLKYQTAQSMSSIFPIKTKNSPSPYKGFIHYNNNSKKRNESRNTSINCLNIKSILTTHKNFNNKIKTFNGTGGGRGGVHSVLETNISNINTNNNSQIEMPNKVIHNRSKFSDYWSSSSNIIIPLLNNSISPKRKVLSHSTSKCKVNDRNNKQLKPLSFSKRQNALLTNNVLKSLDIDNSNETRVRDHHVYCILAKGSNSNNNNNKRKSTIFDSTYEKVQLLNGQFAYIKGPLTRENMNSNNETNVPLDEEEKEKEKGKVNSDVLSLSTLIYQRQREDDKKEEHKPKKKPLLLKNQNKIKRNELSLAEIKLKNKRKINYYNNNVHKYFITNMKISEKNIKDIKNRIRDTLSEATECYDDQFENVKRYYERNVTYL